MQPVCVCVCVRACMRAGDRGVAWLVCSFQSVMSAPLNVGHSVFGVRLLCVFSWFFPRRKPGSGPVFALDVAPTAIEHDKLAVAERGRISVPLGSIMTCVC